jgi:hypothetical protein
MTDQAILLLGCSVSLLTLGAGYMITRNHFLAAFSPTRVLSAAERGSSGTEESASERVIAGASPF